MRIVFVLLSLSFLYSSAYERSLLELNHHTKHPSWVFTMGNSVPTNLYDSYASNGFTFKIALEKPLDNRDNFRYNFGWQNISFGENVVSYDSWNGYEIREGEKANLFDVGVKFIINEGVAGNGLFRPYINGSIGFGFFKQYTVYDAPNTWENTCDTFFSTLLHIIFNNDCDTYLDDNESTVVDNRMYSPFMTVDFGTLFTFHNRQDWSTIDDEESFTDMVGRKLNADYKTIYLGLSWYFMPPAKKHDTEGGYGKQI